MRFTQITTCFAALIFFAACNSNQSKSAEEANTDSVVNTVETAPQTQIGNGAIEFKSDSYDFGTVKEGEVVDHTFQFTNTGTAPVILSAVTASCGCTTPDYTKDPILPGKSGEIKVSFNSQGQVGKQQKIVTISSNAVNNVTTVKIEGLVETKS